MGVCIEVRIIVFPVCALCFIDTGPTDVKGPIKVYATVYLVKGLWLFTWLMVFSYHVIWPIYVSSPSVERT